jgi:hypothetical protein
MKTISLKTVVAAVLAAALVSGCVSTASDGRYQTDPRGGWDNFRAEMSLAAPAEVSIA